MITEDQYDKLDSVSSDYLNGDSEIPDIERVMQDVFGADRTGVDAKNWSSYWTALYNYWEQMNEGVEDLQIPMVCDLFVINVT